MTDFVRATGAAGPAVQGASATHVALPDRFGDCWIERTALDDGLTVVHSHYRPTRELAEETVQAGISPTLVITLGLAGESGFVAREGTRLRFRAGHTTLTAFNESRGERRFNADGAVRQLRLVLTGTALSRYLGEAAVARLASRSGVRILGEHATPPWCRALLRPLLASEATPLDRHIAALTLAAEYLRPLMPTGASAAPSSSHLGADDIDKLQRARDLMRSHMDRALTIAYLSTTVGMNECKFKQGFRELFGAPPHRFLLELRMRRAWTLLESGSRVAQAAYAVGYEHPASFSAAFARYFGRTPKSVSGGLNHGTDPI
ncbi:hypothetical protein TMEC54S_03539 [Thauera mechernichensis]